LFDRGTRQLQVLLKAFWISDARDQAEYSQSCVLPSFLLVKQCLKITSMLLFVAEKHGFLL
jgi:hypothetical protein